MDTLELLIHTILSLKTDESKKQIQNDLPAIEQALQSDKNTRVKIVAGLDIPKSKQLIQSQLNTITNQTNIPTINVGLNIDNNITQNISSGLQQIQQQAQQTGDAINQTLNTTAVSSEQINQQQQLNRFLQEQVDIQNNIYRTRQQIASIENNPNASGQLSELRSQLATHEARLTTMRQENTEMAQLMSIERQEEYVLAQTTAQADRLAVAIERAADRELRSRDIAERKAEALKAQIASYEAINTKAAKIYKSDFDNLKTALDNSPEKVDEIRAKFATLKAEIKVAGKEGKSFFQTVSDAAKKFSGWMSMTTIISALVRDIKKMVTNVVELDTALIDLKKTFQGTDAELNAFYKSSNQIAKDLGVTTKQIIEQAAAWSRLGYSTKEAAENMSKYSAIFATISPGMDIDKATDGLVSIMKAFGIEVDDVLDGIVSKVNIIGNKFATDNASIVEAMTRSSSAMAAANNTLEETIALNTASIEITRNAETTATAWRTISMRLRGKPTLPPCKEIYMLCA